MASNQLPFIHPDAPNLDVMSLEGFKMWSDSALKVFLAVRSKPCDGTSEELAARAFVTWEERIGVNSDREHEQRTALLEYKNRLHIDGFAYSDPYSLSGWSTEKRMELWPSLYFQDIAEYLRLKTPSELYHRLLNEYKQGKAFRYFSSGWVKNVEYHPISRDSPLCFLKAKVTPSMSISQKPYQVWLAVEKDVEGHCGGAIKSGYCTCPAGLQGSCNHLAGVAFRIEYAVRTGLTKPSCTSTPSQWNLPGAKAVHTAVKVVDMKWKKDHYSKSDETNKRAASVQNLANVFSPLTQTQELYTSDSMQVRNDLYGRLRELVPDSCFVQMMEKKSFPAKPTLVCPAPPTELGTSEAIDTPKLLFLAMQLTEEEIDIIEKKTVDQSFSNDWVEQRKGRITASRIHSAFTRMKTIEDDPEQNADNLVALMMGYKKTPTTLPMKHGLAMETHAKVKFQQYHSSLHKQPTYADSGLVVDKVHPFLAASPDYIVSCICHGKGLLEIKCPYNIRDEKPSHANIKYLQNNNNSVFLKHNHPYYSQIQAQMAILEVDYCYFFIYTSHGHYVELIQYDKSCWDELLKKSQKFWFSFLAPEILTRRLKHQMSNA